MNEANEEESTEVQQNESLEEEMNDWGEDWHDDWHEAEAVAAADVYREPAPALEELPSLPSY